MKDILDEIVSCKRKEVEGFKELLPEREIHRQVEAIIAAKGNDMPSMSRALLTGSGIIAEFKRRSPSKGWIKESGLADTIPLDYQRNGASAVSILADERFFGGRDSFITTARQSGVTIPILYKNFIIDEYQLFQAKLCGASAVLLIAACLKRLDYRCLLRMAHELQLEVLLETHSIAELEYADDTPDMCGINNRNLGTFVTDVQNSFLLASRLPEDTVKVSESGISDPETVKALRLAGFNGFLIGESFMKTDNPGKSLRSFIEETNSNL